MAKKSKNILGAWSFLAGVILAVIVGVMPSWSATSGTAALVLVVLGIVIGLLNVGGKELKDFMLAGAVLVVVSALAGGNQYLGLIPYVGNIVNALVVLFVPATIVVALKSLFAMAKK